MLHELLFGMLGYSGDVFNEQTFTVSKGFPFLHYSERCALDHLGQLGLQYCIIQKFIGNKSKSIFKANLTTAIDSWMDGYRSLICEIEQEAMKPNATLAAVQVRLEMVFISSSVSYIIRRSCIDDNRNRSKIR